VSNDSILVRHVLECISRIEEDASEGRDAFFASRRIIVEEDVPHLKRSMVELSDRIGGS